MPDGAHTRVAQARGPQRARFWLAGVEAGEAPTSGGAVGVEQLSFLPLPETGLVRVKSQEWPMEIKARPVAKLGEGNGVSIPLVLGGPARSSASHVLARLHWH